MMRDLLEEYVFASNDHKKEMSARNLAELNPYLFECKENERRSICLGDGELTILYPDGNEFVFGMVKNFHINMKDDKIDTMSYMLGAINEKDA